jgi:hypothetical protein
MIIEQSSHFNNLKFVNNIEEHIFAKKVFSYRIVLIDSCSLDSNHIKDGHF